MTQKKTEAFLRYILFVFSLIIYLPAQSHAAKFAVNTSDGFAASEVAIFLYPQNQTVAPSDIQEPVKIMQKGFAFEPRITVVKTGTRVTFPNRDQSHHHLYSFSKAHPFEFKLYKGDSPEITLNEAGVITMGCNIHDWMLGYVVVADTPFHGLSNKNGEVEIQGLPHGEYKIKFWHPSLEEADFVTYSEDSVSIKDEVSPVVLTLETKLDGHSWPKKPGHIDRQYD